jgi:nucleotide-binding universal stress UspA family protein
MIQRILFGTDFGPHTRKAEAMVLELAKALGARVFVLHAIEPLATVGDEAPDREFYAGLEQRARDRMERLVARFAEQGVESEPTVLIGPRWREVVDRARAIDASLIVVGGRPIDEPPGVAAGSTSHRVFLAASQPVLVVRDDGTVDI